MNRKEILDREYFNKGIHVSIPEGVYEAKDFVLGLIDRVIPDSFILLISLNVIRQKSPRPALDWMVFTEIYLDCKTSQVKSQINHTYYELTEHAESLHVGRKTLRESIERLKDWELIEELEREEGFAPRFRETVNETEGLVV